MLFMVIEHFRDQDMIPVYRRFRERGRTLPAGLEYVDSWVEANFSRCFQLMRCDDLRLLQEWQLQWRGAGVTFEIVPVTTSREAQGVVAPVLDSPVDAMRPETFSGKTRDGPAARPRGLVELDRGNSEL